MTEAPLLSWLSDQAAQREQTGLRRTLKPRSDTEFTSVLDLASNDYLGLAIDPSVVAAAGAAAARWGAGATGSRLVTGSTQLHSELEHSLADHVGATGALVFSSGYLANLGAITALADKQTLVVSDALNHASLIDAIRLSGARVVVTPHCDLDAVTTALRNRNERKALVVTDAVFSVDGDLAPLHDLHSIAREHAAVLLIDEAHSLGVIGVGGRGAAFAAGIAGEPDVIQTLTLSKALGSQGGAVAASPQVIQHLVSSARSFIFDTGLAPACAGSALQALQQLSTAPKLASQARQHATALADAARAVGWKATEPAGAVVSVLVGKPDDAVAAAASCYESGVRVGCFRPPSIPDEISRLRLTARANLTESDLVRAQQALARAHLASGRA